ncbi:uncharacterized protein LOC135955456 [Calliphora vicina]|uniref:uncharacterized protein LOC135955456 n=1 Tax=Calliphora vicina TaxID=7373 RepID=UPI00325A9577
MYGKHENSLLTLVILAVIYSNVTAARNPLRTIVKFTDMRCRATAPELMYFKECRLQRDANVTMRAITLCRIYDKPLKQVKLNVQGFRKRNVGYVPFVLNLSLDWCQFLETRNNIVLQRMFGLLEKESNLNTTCPIDLDYTYMNVSMDNDGVFVIPFKWPTGDYRFDITIDANDEIRLIVNAFFRLDW